MAIQKPAQSSRKAPKVAKTRATGKTSAGTSAKKMAKKAVKKSVQKAAAKTRASKVEVPAAKKKVPAAKKSAPAAFRVPAGRRALVLTGFGINSDMELAAAFEMAGARAERVHVNRLIERPGLLDEIHLLAIPGGFSFGDHLGSGRVLANKLKHRLGAPLERFAASGRPVLGICNGFQVLVKLGLLPGLSGGFRQDATLTHNDSGRFEDRWVRLAVRKNHRNLWLDGVDSVELPVRHGEGKLVFADPATLARVKALALDLARYADAAGRPTGAYPDNPNGSADHLAALGNEAGNVFGLMPHPEAFCRRVLRPGWRKGGTGMTGPSAAFLKPEEGAGLVLFKNAVRRA